MAKREYLERQLESEEDSRLKYGINSLQISLGTIFYYQTCIGVGCGYENILTHDFGKGLEHDLTILFMGLTFGIGGLFLRAMPLMNESLSAQKDLQN